MKGKGKWKIGTGIVAAVLLIGVTLSIVAVLVGWRSSTAADSRLLQQIGQNTVDTLAANLTAGEVDGYYQSRIPDERYYEVQRLIHTMTDEGQFKYLYVCTLQENGLTYIFDAEGGVDANGHCELGYYEDADDIFQNLSRQVAEGGVSEPFTSQAADGEMVLVTAKPICYGNGTVAGYAVAELGVGEVLHREHMTTLFTALLLLGLTGLFVGLSLYAAKIQIIRPIQVLTDAAEDYEDKENKKALRALKTGNKGELSDLAAAFQMMLAEIQMSSYSEKEVTVREERLESEVALAREISVALLPKSLPRRREGYPFAVRGLLCPEESLFGTFYDYFLGEKDRLCVLLGGTPGEGVSQMLYTAMARAILKSQLRSGLGLAEALTEANRQIYDLSDTLSLNVLVGVLDSNTGRFTYVNAGGESPFLLRSQDRYRRVEAPTHSPLGQSANVTYPVQELTLQQGDRLLLFSEELADIPDGEGRKFAEKAMNAVLNEKALRLGTLERLLSNLSARGTEFAAHPGEIEGYALLVLEYNRKNQVMAHQTLSANAVGGGVMRKFVRTQMEANGLSAQRTAEIVVLGDELFSLCCRQAEEDSRFMAECEVPAGEKLVRLRIKGSMGGRNPLLNPAGEAARNGAAFIQRSCEQVLFEQKNNTDSLTIVRRLPD